MKKLIRLLKQAHAIEVGAYQAYEGHWKNIKPLSNPIRGKVKRIQIDELLHKEAIEKMLKELDSKPSFILDSILFIIGRSISIGCYIFGYRMTMWGAKIMEILGSNTYWELSKVAYEAGSPKMCRELRNMAYQEEEHEKFFKECIEEK